MKQIRSQIEKNKSGFVTLKAENDEDMWHAYNLVTVVRFGSYFIYRGIEY
jgi:protein pelota